METISLNTVVYSPRMGNYNGQDAWCGTVAEIFDAIYQGNLLLDLDNLKVAMQDRGDLSEDVEYFDENIHAHLLIKADLERLLDDPNMRIVSY